MKESQEGKFLNLDHRHLAFFFLAAVGVCAVFFSLGYVVGRAHSSASLAIDPWAERNSSEPQVALDPPRSGETTSKGNPQPSGTEPRATMKSTEDAASSTGEPQPELDFYKAVKEPNVEGSFHPDTAAGKKAGKPEENSAPQMKTAPGPTAQLGARKSEPVFSLQVAALKSVSEAERLAKALRSKGYQVYIIHPGKNQADKLIRIQVGPYNSESETNTIRKKLELEGYKTIIKRQ